MKAISKILAIVSLALISFSSNAQEVDRTAKIKPINKSVIKPVPTESGAKTEAQPANMKKPVRKAMPMEKKTLKKEAINE